MLRVREYVRRKKKRFSLFENRLLLISEISERFLSVAAISTQLTRRNTIHIQSCIKCIYGKCVPMYEIMRKRRRNFVR